MKKTRDSADAFAAAGRLGGRCSVPTCVPRSSVPLQSRCLVRSQLQPFYRSVPRTMAEYSYVKSTKLVLKGTKAKR